MKKRNLKKPVISALEQRILFDGAAVATAVDVLDNSSFTPTSDSTTVNDVTNNNAENSVHEAQAVQSFEKPRREVAFVDVTVSDYQTLVDGIGEGVETYLVSSMDDIKTILANETNIDAIHILSHGSTGEITVGNDILNQTTLNNFDAVLQNMKSSLSADGDILLYGCNVASDGIGQEFINLLASKTQADVAASSDITGSSNVGGDWDLEVNSGTIETQAKSIYSYDSQLGTPSITNLNSGTYIENASATIIDGNITITNGGSYDGKYIEYSITGAKSTETLSLTNASNVNASGAISFVGSSVYLGNGSSRDVIGSIDSTYNGLNGQKLRINFVSSFQNSSFETGTITGWTAMNQMINLGSTSIAGWTSQDTSDYSTNANSGGNDNDVPSGSYSTSVVSETGNRTDGSYALKLTSSMTTANGYDVVHGPAVYSSEFQASAGDVIYFDWRAYAGGDDFDAFGYIVNVANGNQIEVLDATGSSNTAWVTKATTISTAGTYRFVFVNGTYDASGGMAAGGQLYIDNVKVYGSKVNDSVVSKISNQIAYSNTSDNPDSSRTFNITAVNSSNLSSTASTTIAITAVNDAPILNTTPDNSKSDILYDSTNLSTYTGTTISDFISNGSITDPDVTTAPEAIYISAVDNSQGTWQYKDSSGTWQNIIIPANQALLLDSSDSIRFLPNSTTNKYLGEGTITFGAWDKSSGTAKTYSNISSKGGTTAFSTATDTAKFTVAGKIDLADDYGWIPILVGDNFDPNDDVQAKANGVDLVGDSSNPLLYMQYNAKTGELAFRIREESYDGKGTFYLLGIIGNKTTGAIDFFIGIDVPANGGTPTVKFYDAGTGANTSPSTTSFLTKTAVSATDSLVEITSTGTDLDSNGKIDGFINLKFKASSFVTYANSTAGGQTNYTIDKSLGFVLLTATQTNSINGDIGGINGTSSQTYKDLGLVTDISFTNTAPTSSNDSATINEDSSYTFSVANDFAFNDTDSGNTLSSIKITSLPTNGDLMYSTNGSTWSYVTLNQEISIATIDAGRLKFVPIANEFASAYSTFSFKVSDGKAYSINSYTFTMNVNNVNDVPVITNINKDVQYWTYNNEAVSLDPFSYGVVSDIDSSDFNSGVLTITVAGGTASHNQLSVVDNGNITISSNNISYDGTQIATFSGGTNGTNLVITFNANATQEKITELIQALRFTYTGTEFIADSRTITMKITDGDGGQSAVSTLTMVGPPIYQVKGYEDTTLIFNGDNYNIGTSDTIKITKLNANNGTWYYINGTTKTVVTNDLQLTSAQFDTLTYEPNKDVFGNGLDSLSYKTKGTPSSVGFDSSGLSYIQPTLIISLQAVNDAAVIDLNGDSVGTNSYVTFKEINGADETYNDVKLVTDRTINLSDVDNTKLQYLTLSGTYYSGDQIILGNKIFDLSKNNSGTTSSGFSYSVVTSGSNFTLKFTKDSLISDYETLLDGLTFNNSSDSPSTIGRVYNISVNDGVVDSNVATANVAVIATNDAPTMNDVTLNTQYDWGIDQAKAILPNITLNDLDGNITSVSLTIDSALAGDILNFTNTLNVTGSYNSTTGVLTLTNTGTTQDMQNALRSVTFSSSVNSDGIRNIDIVASDNYGTSTNIATTNVNLVNNTPIIDLKSTSDTGVSSVDNLTNDNTPTFSVRVPTSSNVGDILYLYSTNGQVLGSYTVIAGSQGTDVDITTIALADGFQTIVAKIGSFSSSNPQAELEVVIDATAPTFVDQTIEYKENQTVNTILGKITSSDSNKVVAYEITGGTGSGYFAIDNNGNISITSSGITNANDFEATNSFTLDVKAKDSAGNEITKTITMNLTNVDEATPTFNNQSVNYNENQLAEAVIHTITASDDIAITSFKFTNGTNTSSDGYFTVDNSGKIRITQEGVKSIYNNDELAPATFTYNIKAYDAVGNEKEATITLSVNDINEAPVLSNIKTASVIDQATGNALSTNLSGILSSYDQDGDNLTYSIIGQTVENNTFGGISFTSKVTGTYGTLYLNSSTGAYEYIVNQSAVDALKTVDPVEAFTLKVTDNGSGTLSDTKAFVINIKCANDTPTMSSAAQIGSLVEDGNTSSSITITPSDLDTSDTTSYDFTGWTLSGTTYTKVGTYGSLAYDTTNANIFVYTLNNSDTDTDNLAQGEIANDIFAITLKDSSNASSSKNISFTITGANDAPVISVQSADLATSGLTETNTRLTQTDTLTVRDIDILDKVTASVSGVTTTGGTYTGTLPSNDTLKNMMSVTLEQINANTSDVNNLTWKFDSGSEAFNFLASGETLVLTYSIKVNDGVTDSAAQNVTITITGTNDNPDITVESGNSAGETLIERTIYDVEKLEPTNTLNYSGTLTLKDSDISNTVSVSKVSVTANGTTAGLSSDNSALLSMLTINSNVISNSMDTGTINWSFDSGSENFAYLAGGETLTLTYTIRATDSNNPTATDDQTIIITIKGVDTAPIIKATTTGATIIDTADNDTFTNVTGTLSAFDVDSTIFTYSINSADSSAVVRSGFDISKTGTYGILYLNSTTGAYEYVPNDSVIESLKTQESETFTFQVSDGTLTDTKNLVITIKGDNDTASVSGNLTGNVIEDTTISTTGTVTVADRDSEDNGKVQTQTNTAGTYGTFTILENGNWTYNADNSNSAIQNLKAGATLKDTFSVLSFDGTASKNVVITITGTNDTVELSDTTNPTAISENIDASSQDISLTTGTFAVSDIDVGDTLTASIVGTPTVQLNGSTITTGFPAGLIESGVFTITPTTQTSINGAETAISWTYNPNAVNLDFLKVGDSLTVTYSIKINDGTADSSTQDVTITITGTNDAPIITSNFDSSSKTTIVESNEANRTATGDFLVSDIDGTSFTTSVSSVSINLNSTAPDLGISNADLEAMLSTTDSSGKFIWNFNSGSEKFDKLAKDEILILDYTIEVKDNNDGVTNQKVTIIIKGTNDDIIISAHNDNLDSGFNNTSSENNKIESNPANASNTTYTETGTITYSNVDLSDSVSVSTNAKSVSFIQRGSISELTTEQFNNLAAGFTTSINSTTKEVSWDYTITQDKIAFLGAGDTVTAVMEVLISDGEGSTVSRDITITIVGKNSAPIITETSSNSSQISYTESNSAINQTINVLDVTDANLYDIVNGEVISGTYQVSGGTERTMTNAELAWLKMSNYQLLSRVQTTGDLSLLFNTDSETFDWLDSAQTLTLKYTIKATDDVPSNELSDTQVVTIVITGTNDTPVAVVDTVTTTENSSITIDVLANDTDADDSDTSSNFVLLSGGSDAPTISTNDHSTGYNALIVINVATVSVVDNKLVFNPGDEFDYLASGETAQVVITYKMSDNENQISTSTATITITGANDTPIISLLTGDTNSISHTESTSTLVVNGRLIVNDKDTSNIVNAEITAVSINGDIPSSLNNQHFKDMLSLYTNRILDNETNEGKIEWSFDSLTDKFEYVSAGEQLVLTYTIKVEDGTGFTTQDITITITGTNDLPTVETDSVTTNENSSMVIDVLANDSDIDLLDSLTLTTLGIPNITHGASYINSVSTNPISLSIDNNKINFNPGNEFDYLATGETATISVAYTVKDSQNATSTANLYITIVGTNDVPTVSFENIDFKVSFGEVYTKDISELFSDIDTSDKFKFEALNLPRGLSIDSNTGIITGRLAESGNFVITISGTDSQGASVTRTYNMLVIAPPQPDTTIVVETPRFSETNTYNNDITLNNFNDNTQNLGVLNYSSSEGISTDTGSGFLGTEASLNNQVDGANDNTPLTNTSNPNDSKGVLQANVDLNVLTNGQVVFDKGNQDSFSIVGITIEDIKVENNFIEIKVVDTNLSQNFIITQTDGTPLPAGLSFDPKTGTITGTIPEDLEKIDISIKAINQDGTTRVLNLKLDLKELKNKAQVKQVDADEKYIGLKEQIAMENQKLDGYGSYLTRLFA